MINYTDPKDAAALEAKRDALMRQLDAHGWRRRRVALGVASPETVACIERMRYLTRVTEGPRRLIGLRLARHA